MLRECIAPVSRHEQCIVLSYARIVNDKTCQIYSFIQCLELSRARMRRLLRRRPISHSSLGYVCMDQPSAGTSRRLNNQAESKPTCQVVSVKVYVNTVPTGNFQTSENVNARHGWSGDK